MSLVASAGVVGEAGAPLAHSGTATATAGPIAVAMSGGLDSSVAASLLAERTDQVIGLSMLLWDRSQESANGRCCGALDLGDARRVAHQLEIPHYTLRMDDSFRRRVVDPFIDDYLAGRTPSPCIRCNTWIKFDLLLQRARALGAVKLATGHYARVLEGTTGFELHAACDASKDQSYYLFELSQEQLAATLFPLGEMTKQETRQRARELGLSVAEKGESYDICFVAGGVQEFLEEQLGERGEDAAGVVLGEGAEVVDSSGRRLGTGAPFYRYTVGQRRGLGIATGERLYVLGVDPQRNRVRVGSAAQLAAHGLLGERVHWIGEAPKGAIEASVKIRSRHRGVDASIREAPGGGVEVRFATPQAGVAPGQAAVFYQGSKVLGGCWIVRSIPAPA